MGSWERARRAGEKHPGVMEKDLGTGKWVPHAGERDLGIQGVRPGERNRVLGRGSRALRRGTQALGRGLRRRILGLGRGSRVPEGVSPRKYAACSRRGVRGSSRYRQLQLTYSLATGPAFRTCRDPQ